MAKITKQNILNSLKKIKAFIQYDIWKIELSSISNVHAIILKLIRTFTLAYRGFKEDKVNLRASALTFFSVLSVVPVVAMGFGIAKGFGFEDNLQQLLQDSLKGQEDVATWIISFSNNLLSDVSGGLILGVGIGILFWTVLKVLGNIENAFNQIWQVRNSRVFFRKFSDYFAILLIAPILFVISSSLQVFLLDSVDKIAETIPLIGYLKPVFNLVQYMLIWLLFTFIYMVMPNTKVNFGAALLAGIIAGTGFSLLQWGYIHFQVGVSKYNTIYGGFAALPLFLIWMNWSWLIVLLGAEISFSAQNHKEYEFETDIKGLNLKSKQLISLFISHSIIKTFEKGEDPETSQTISEKLKLPVRLVRYILYELVECRIIAETPSKQPKEPAFLPAKDIHAMNIQYLINQLQNKGIAFNFSDDNKEMLNKIEVIIDGFDKMAKTSDINKKLQDI
ncbi:MAG: YihY/virulence factor BrkB family protein [Salinivirgaceae bacterium]|nr:YihY/virulence factor BrkB family protein [Salinivirgaceae bacterium]